MIIAAFHAECMQDRAALQRDQELITCWKGEWAHAGFDPKIIGIEHATKHPKFHDLNRFGLRMPTINHPMFEWLCWIRWCAIAIFAQQTRHGCLFTDYDVFPAGLYSSVELGSKIDQVTIQKGAQIVNFDPQGGAGLMFGTARGFDTIIDRILTYVPDGQEITNDAPHISDMIVLQRHCRSIWQAGPADLQVVCPDATDTYWPLRAFVHFGGAYRTMRHLTKAEEIRKRLYGDH